MTDEYIIDTENGATVVLTEYAVCAALVHIHTATCDGTKEPSVVFGADDLIVLSAKLVAAAHRLNDGEMFDCVEPDDDDDNEIIELNGIFYERIENQ